MDAFIQYLIDNIEMTLRHYIFLNQNNDEIKYIYMDRNDKSNFHIIFPNIILNKYQAQTIRVKVLENIMENNAYRLTIETYEDIIDEAVFIYSGLKPIYQKKPHENFYYEINKEKSTYKKIPDNKIGRLQVTSIRRPDKCANVNLQIDDNGFPLLLFDQEKLNNNKKPKSFIKKTKKDNDVDILNNDEDNENDVCKLALDIPENMLKDLFDNLSAKRYSEFLSWIKIMFICINYRLRLLEHEVSMKCPKKYDKNEIEELFKKNKRSADHANPITTNLLFMWSKEDNPKKHEEIINRYKIDGYYKEVSYTVINELVHLKYATMYESDFVKPFDITDKSFILKSSLGTNKTGECIKAITDISEKEQINRISCMASRVVLCSDLANRFIEPLYKEQTNRPINLQMKNYSLFKKPNLYDQDRLVQTPDSLIHMQYPCGKIIIPDIVFIDEIESLLEYVCTSDTLSSKRIIIYEILRDYIKNAKYLFLVDGNLSKPIVEFLYELRGDNNLKFIYNTKETDDNKYYFMKNESEWKAKLDDYLKQKKNIYIPTDSKEFSDFINNHVIKNYPDYKVQLYNADTDDEHKINLGNVNETWKNFDIIICSPTILYGVNFSEIHFDVIFGYYQTVILPASVYQQLRRIRFVKEKQAYIFLNDPKEHGTIYYPTSTNELASYILRHLKEFSKTRDSLKITCNRGYKLDSEDSFTKLFLYFIAERHKANNNYLMELIIKINEWGGKCFVEVKKGQKNEEYNIEKKEEINEFKEKKRKDLLIANEIILKSNDKTKLYEEIEKKLYKTIHDKNILTIRYICNTFGLDILNDEFLKDLGRITNVEKFHKSAIYFGNDEFVKKFIEKQRTVEYDQITGILFKQVRFIKECIELFWKDGILSTKEITVLTGKNSLSAEQTLFIKINEKDLRISFRSLKRKARALYSYQLLRWLDCMLMEFFGGFISLNISGQYKKRYKEKNDML